MMQQEGDLTHGFVVNGCYGSAVGSVGLRDGAGVKLLHLLNNL